MAHSLSLDPTTGTQKQPFMIRAVGVATWTGGNGENEKHEHYTYGLALFCFCSFEGVGRGPFLK